jgi:hypothetical protein
MGVRSRGETFDGRTSRSTGPGLAVLAPRPVTAGIRFHSATAK